MKVTPKILDAVKIATRAHRHQNRKATDTPYIVHPSSVMLIASQVTDDEDTLIACLFHDILEDVSAEYPESKMLDEFGDSVVTIVKGVTKDDSILGWQPRSEAYLATLKNIAPDESVIVAAADKIHNLTTIIEDYPKQGENFWNRFGSGQSQQIWFYQQSLEVVKQRIPDLPLVVWLENLLGELNRLVAK